MIATLGIVDAFVHLATTSLIPAAMSAGTKRDVLRNGASPEVRVDPAPLAVTIGGRCTDLSPATSLPMAGATSCRHPPARPALEALL